MRIPEAATTACLFRAARELAGLSRDEAAAAIGISEKTYSRTERGERRARIAELHAMAAATGQPLDFFLPPPPERRSPNQRPLVAASA